VSHRTEAAAVTAIRVRELVAATAAGDSDACRELVELFLPATAAMARRFVRATGVGRQELLQEGVAGLLHAARRYDPVRGTPFWGYAVYWVRKAMQDVVADLAMPVVLSDRAVRSLADLRAAHDDHLRVHREEPTSTQLAGATGFSRMQVELLREAARSPRSLEAPAGLGTTVGEHVRDQGAELAFERVLDAIEIREVRQLTALLGARERTVLHAHYGLGTPPRTLKQIGEALGVTAERARQIESGALDKLRNSLAR
jgi:RNA polymerase primary sigma factor